MPQVCFVLPTARWWVIDTEAGSPVVVIVEDVKNPTFSLYQQGNRNTSAEKNFTKPQRVKDKTVRGDMLWLLSEFCAPC